MYHWNFLPDGFKKSEIELFLELALSLVTELVLGSWYLENPSYGSKPTANIVHLSDTALFVTDAVRDRRSGHDHTVLFLLEVFLIIRLSKPTTNIVHVSDMA